MTPNAAPAAIEVLPRIMDNVGDKLTVSADSGVRRGSDIAKFIALGAQAVLIERAVLYRVAVGGEEGASDVVNILRDEFERTLSLLGVPILAELSTGDFAIRPPVL